MWVAGNADQPWIWCNKCGAYTNKSVRNLAKPCKGKGTLTYADRLTRGLEPKRETEVIGFPRRLTWADIGGKPYVITETPDNNTSGASALEAANAYRALKVSELRTQLHAQTSHRRSINALTGAVSTNRRRPCHYPTPRQPAIPQADWRPPSPGATPVRYDDLPMFQYSGVHHIAPVARSEEDGTPAAPPTLPSAPFSWPEDDFLTSSVMGARLASLSLFFVSFLHFFRLTTCGPPTHAPTDPPWQQGSSVVVCLGGLLCERTWCDVSKKKQKPSDNKYNQTPCSWCVVLLASYEHFGSHKFLNRSIGYVLLGA